MAFRFRMEGFKPGATLALITEEYEMMENVREFLHKKLQLDRQYTKDMRLLLDSINSKCREGAISSLLSPLIGLFESENSQRQSTCDVIEGHLKPLPYSSPNRPDTLSGAPPLSLYEPLEQRYEEVRRQHEKARTPESISELQTWYRSLPAEWAGDRLPTIDRRYRQTLCAQHQVSRSASYWHDGSLSSRLEEHQTNAESLKKQLRGVLDATIQLDAEIVQSTSVAIDGTDRFSSFSFVAPKHSMASEERDHSSMQSFKYHNFWLDGKETPSPIFGTTREQLEVNVGHLFDVPEWRQINRPRNKSRFIDYAVELEKHGHDGLASSQVRLNLLSYPRHQVLMFALLSEEKPLLPLDDATFQKYKAGVPRGKIESLLPRDDIALRILRKFAESTFDADAFAHSLTHRKDAKKIVRDIFLKWDFANNNPFQEGVARQWLNNRVYPHKVVTKTGLRHKEGTAHSD